MNNDDLYIKGGENKLIRYYFYLSNGLNIINEFRNLFIGIVAIYIALKFTSVWWMVVMFVPSVIVLTVLGYYVVHKVSKVRDYLGTKFGSHYGIRNFNYAEESYKRLEEIRDLLQKNNKV